MKELIKITTNEQGQQLVSARELYEGLEIKTKYQDWFKRMCEYGFEENVDFTTIEELFQKREGSRLVNRFIETHIITIDMAKDLCRKQRRNIKAGEYLKALLSIDNKEVMIVEPKRKELEFLDMLEKTLEPFNYTLIRQYKVLNYRIDLYIQDLNIAIEYDENNHINYSYERHEGRQKEIEKKLKCKFIRISDKESNLYNIGTVIKKIMEIIQYNETF